MWKKTLLSALCVATLAFGAAFTGTANAAYPDRPIKLIVPFGPGGSSDIGARILATHLAKQLKTDIPVVNIYGASGFAGTLQAAEAKPDGYTLLWHLPTFMTSYHTGVSRITWCDMAPVARVQQFYEVLVVPSDAPWKTVDELVADAKANPGKINWGTNIGAGIHFMALDFADATGTVGKWNYVAAGGDEKLIKELLGKHIDVGGLADMVVVQHVKNGSLRALGAFTDERLASFPDLPTFKEMGINSSFIFDCTLYAPKGTDPAVLKTLQDAIKTVSENPEYIKELEGQFLTPAYLDGQALNDMLLDQDVKFYKFSRLGNLIPPRK